MNALPIDAFLREAEATREDAFARQQEQRLAAVRAQVEAAGLKDPEPAWPSVRLDSEPRPIHLNTLGARYRAAEWLFPLDGHEPDVRRFVSRTGAYRYRARCECGWAGGASLSRITAIGAHRRHLEEAGLR